MGNIEEGLFPEIYQRLEKVVCNHPPATLTAKGIGIFPQPARPRVFWVGLDGDLAPLQRLQIDIEAAFEGLPVKPAEDREFVPHLTIGRVQFIKKPEPVIEVLNRYEATRFGEIPINALTVYKSELTRDGARYTKLKTFNLGT